VKISSGNVSLTSIRSNAWALFLVVIAAMPIVAESAQSKPDQKKAPAVLGRLLFVNKCSVCHGSTGQGDDGPSLHGLKLSDAALTSIIETGFKGEMPGFKTKLKAQDLKALIAYIRTLK
jgi:mono/diheme cytochrome c family protein